MKTILSSEVKVGMHVYPGQYLGCVEIIEIKSITDKIITFRGKQSDKVKTKDPFLNITTIGKRLNSKIKILD